jgi:GT2 family glycosyltransferase
LAETQISVVVPVRDGEETLPALLASLENQTLPRERFETIVVDNGSGDRSAEVARHAGATVVAEGRPNRAAARNRGVEEASATKLAFIDADCVAGPGWLEALHSCLEETPLATGPVRLVTGDAPNRVERLERISRFDQERGAKEHGWAATANLGVQRQAFSAVGGFDPGFRHIGEDVDFCLRAAAIGSPLGWCPRAEVCHRAESRMGPVVGRAFRHGYASAQLRRRHGAEVGRRYWAHPGPLVRGDWALRRFDPDAGQAAEGERDVLLLGRVEYAARMVGSAVAGLRGGR